MATSPQTSHDPAARRTLALLALAELLAMSLWFTGTTVLPQLTRHWHAEVSVGAWLTIAVQLGFVAGALLAAIFNLADVLDPIRLFVGSSLLAAVANALFALVAEEHPYVGFALRFLTGAFLAGVYPVGMKIMAGWFRQGRGLALGILVGALTIGSAVPHAVNALNEADSAGWKLVVLHASGLAGLAAIIVALWVRNGPFAAPSPRFHFSQIGETFSNRRLRLANFGYLGHMWELYSVWGWVAVMLAASAAQQGIDARWAEFGAFAVIAIGFIGCAWAGVVSDRAPADADPQARIWQRARVTIYSMRASGTCCLLAALFFHRFHALLIISLVWGIAVIADSAQFSTIVSEVSDSSYVGTALTAQTALGFLLTVAALRATIYIAQHYGWPAANASMAIGPVVGILAMRKLK